MTSDDAIVSVSLPLCEGGVNNEAFLGGNLLEIWARLPVTTLTGGTEELGDLTGGTEELGDGLLVGGMIMYGTTAGKNYSK